MITINFTTLIKSIFSFAKSNFEDRPWTGDPPSFPIDGARLGKQMVFVQYRDSVDGLEVVQMRN